MTPKLCCCLSHQGNIGRCLDKGLADGIHTVFHRKLQTVSIVFGEGAHAQVDPRQVQPLARAQLAPDEHAAMDVFAVDADHLQLNDTVIQKKGITCLHDRGQAREGHEGALPIADDLVRR